MTPSKSFTLSRYFLMPSDGGAVLLHALQEHGGGIVVEGREHDVHRIVVLFGQLEVSLLKSLVLRGVVFFVVFTPDEMAFRVRTGQLDVDRVHVAVNPQNFLLHAQLPGLGRGRGGFRGVAGDKQDVGVGRL